MLIFKTGDIFNEFSNSTDTFLMHGANCCNTMGAGIARIIKERYPTAFEADLKAHNKEKLGFDSSLAGNFSIAPAIEINISNRYILNLYTQIYPGKNFELKFLIEALSKIDLKFCQQYKIKKILLPAIGCGIGGGNWDDVVKIIMKWYTVNFLNTNIDIIMYFPK